VPDLAPLIYPEITEPWQVEKKHRVTILRAAKQVLSALGWGYLKARAPGGPPVFFNTCDFASWGRALTRSAWPNDPNRAEETFADPFGDYWKGELVIGSSGWHQVEAAKARRDGRIAKAEAIEQRLDQEYRHALARFGIQMPAAAE
jgi:hypothetical protein